MVGTLRKSKYAVVFSVFLFILLSSLQVVSVFAIDQPPQMDYNGIVKKIDFEAIMDHVGKLSDLGSRLTGSPGSYEAGEYVYNNFLKYGLVNVTKQLFNVTILRDYGANLTILSSPEESLEIYTLWPNGIRPVTTPPSGIEGPLAYIEGESSSLGDLGEGINGSIVLMEFNTGHKWLEACYFGAKAVVFIEPLDTTREEADLKNLKEVPLNFPRYYVTRASGSRLIHLLKKGEVKARINSLQSWEDVQSYNVIGMVPGREATDRFYIISAYYDSYSIVPSASPGAQEALGLATLLELARYLKENPARFPVMFIAFGGHWQSLAGARRFVEEACFHSNLWQKIKFQFNIFIQTDTPNVAPYMGGGWNDPGVWSMNWYLPYPNLILTFEQITAQVESQLGKRYFIPDIGLRNQQNYPLALNYNPMLESEPLPCSAGGWAISFISIHSFYKFLTTPIDTLDRINLANLKNQLELVYSWLITLTKMDVEFPLTFRRPLRIQVGTDAPPGFMQIFGYVVEWEEGYYKPVPDCLVVLVRLGGMGWVGIRESPPVVLKTDENGRFEIDGLASAYGTWTVPYRIYAFKLDPFGRIVYAPDQGIYGIPTAVAPQNKTYVSVMKCASLVLFDIFDPFFSRASPAQIMVNDFYMHAPPNHFGLQAEGYGESVNRMTRWIQGGLSQGKLLVSIFVSSEETIEVLLQDVYKPIDPHFVLLNASERFPDGVGYKLESGQQLILTDSALNFAKNFYWLNQERMRRLERSGLPMADAEEMQKEVNQIMVEAENARKNGQYTSALHLYYMAWSLARRTNILLRSMNTDTINSVPFYGALLIPFAFLAEQLIFKATGKKKIFNLVGIFTIIALAFYFLHPGFFLTYNTAILILGFVVVTLSIPIFYVIFSQITGLLKGLRKAFGERVVEISRGSAALIAFSTGIENMRKRKMRTSLMLTSIIIIVISLVLFTSLQSLVAFAGLSVPGTATYNGVMVRNELLSSPPVIGSVLEGFGEGYPTAPRSWVLPTPRAQGGKADTHFKASFNGKYITVWGIEGLSPQERDVTGLDRALIEGRWFEDYDVLSCILSETQASELGVKVQDVLSLDGINLTVVGIIDSGVYSSIRDLDGHVLTPYNPYTIIQMQIHYDPSEIIILPHETANRLYPYAVTVSVSVNYGDPEVARIKAEEMSRFLDVNMYLGVMERIFLYTEASSVSLTGGQYLIIPLIIVGVSIFNQVLGNIYERRRDILIMGTIGLSPLHILMFFLSEACVYAVLGSVLGYIVSMFFIRIMNIGYFTNYGSTWVVLPIAMALVAVVLSTIYPAFSISRKAVPSARARWEFTTEPKEDTWEIPLPFIATSLSEVLGIMAYLTEYLESHASPLAEIFYVQSLGHEKSQMNGHDCYSITASIALAPYDLNITQGSRFLYTEDRPDRYVFSLVLNRKTGSVKDWTRFNRRFVYNLREQLLLWRTLVQNEKETYTSKGQNYYKIR